MPIRPGTYRPQADTSTPNVGGNPARTVQTQSGVRSSGGGGFYPASPSFSIAGFFKDVSHFFKVSQEAENARRKAELDNEVAMAEAQFKIGLDDISRQLRHEGIGTEVGRSWQYVEEYKKRAAELGEKVTARVSPEARASFAKRALPSATQGLLGAGSYADDLLKADYLRTHEALSQMAVTRAQNLDLPEAPIIPGDQSYAFADTFSTIRHIDQMEMRGATTAKNAEVARQKIGSDVLKARAKAYVYERPQEFLDRLKDEKDIFNSGVVVQRDEDNAMLVPGLTAADKHTLRGQAEARLKEQDALADKADKERRAAMKRDAEQVLVSLVGEGQYEQAKKQVIYYGSVVGALMGDDFRAWTNFIEESTKATKVVDDPEITLPMLAAPERVSVAEVTLGIRSGKISPETAKQIVVARRSWMEQQENRDVREVLDEAERDFSSYFGYSPFFETSEDERRLAYNSATTEFRAALSKLDLKNMDSGARHRVAMEARQEAKARHGGVMKTKLEDKINTATRSIPTWDWSKTPTENQVYQEQEFERARRSGKPVPEDLKAVRRQHMQNILRWNEDARRIMEDKLKRNPAAKSPQGRSQ